MSGLFECCHDAVDCSPEGFPIQRAVPAHAYSLIRGCGTFGDGPFQVRFDIAGQGRKEGIEKSGDRQNSDRGSGRWLAPFFAQFPDVFTDAHNDYP